LEPNVGGRRDRPPLGPPTASVHRQVDERRNGDTEGCRRYRYGGVAGPPQRTHDQLALELEARDEEEQGEGPIRGPVLHVERPDLQVPELEIGVAPSGVRPHDADDGGGEGDGAAHSLAPEQVAEERGLSLVGLGEDPAFERHEGSFRR
jgi:hypothetical protein